MTTAKNMEALFGEVLTLEEEYRWSECIDRYKNALELLAQESAEERGWLCERIGYALFRVARQAETRDGFTVRMVEACKFFKSARDSYERLNSAKSSGVIRCDAYLAFAKSWLVSTVTERRRLVVESWELAKQGLDGFREEDSRSFAETYNRLMLSAALAILLGWDFEVQGRIMREGISYGENAIRILLGQGWKGELARAYINTATFHGFLSYDAPTPSEKEKATQTARSCWLKARELSEDAALLELPNSLGYLSATLWSAGLEESVAKLRRMLELGERTKDHFVAGCALDWLAHNLFWRLIAAEDPEERNQLLSQIRQYSDEASKHYLTLSFLSPRGSTGSPIEYYWEQANFEPDLGKKREALEQGLALAPDILKRAEDSGCPISVTGVHHALSKLITSLAGIEVDMTRKKMLLEEALNHRKQSIAIDENMARYDYWAQGVDENYMAEIIGELAALSPMREEKLTLLQEALEHKRKGLRLCVKDSSFVGQRPMLWLAVGRWQFREGDLWRLLYESSGNRLHLRNACASYENAAVSYIELNLPGRVAECHWRTAEVYDALDERLKAADGFAQASSSYVDAAKKIPQLGATYGDYSSYLQAWSEIEKARHHHTKQEFGDAKNSYEKAAQLHQSTKKWRYLTQNYAAWAKLEEAEELAESDRSEECIQSYQAAMRLFKEAQVALKAELQKAEVSEERRVISNLIGSVGLRQEYCSASIASEEAKVLAKSGAELASSEKYHRVVETLEKMIPSLDSEDDRREISCWMMVSKALEFSTRAEAEASPSLYAEAAGLFEEAKDLTRSEKGKMLYLGQSRFYRALEAGTKFADTRDADSYGTAVQNLETAADHFLRAGFQKASEYADACKLLFEAYRQIDEANMEKAHEKKTKLYMAAEKLLSASAEAYLKAEYPEKREQVLRLLRKIQKERGLAASITEIFEAPSIDSASLALYTPTIMTEEAVGLEQLQHANVQGNLIALRRDFWVGKKIELELELVNAGKATAQLLRLEGLVPDNFDLVMKPEAYRQEGRDLNLRGRRLEPLKPEEAKFVLEPRKRGIFTLTPRILYLDENGEKKFCEVEPIELKVADIGVGDWLKGPRR